MEKCVDSDYLQPKNGAAKAHKDATCSSNSCLSSQAEEKNKCKNCCKVSRVDQKIASQERSSGAANPIFNGTRETTRRHRTGTRVNVLKKHATETARQSVQKKTKINKSNVPDRLEKYVSSSVRCETKLSLSDGRVETKTKTPSSRVSSRGSMLPEEEVSMARDGYTETKIALLGNECLNNKEADRLRNSFESDSETKNIFENFFHDCLDSTSKREGVSSQEDVNRVNYLGGRRGTEKTPEKTKAETPSFGAPMKVKDHSSYYSGRKNMRHVCEYCHKIFKSNGKLNSHVYSHTGERPFDCSHCGKAFSSKFKLVRHLLIHSEVRKFVCQICDRTFLRNDHLKNHYKVHDPQKKMYKCPKENCDKEYSSIMSHKKHMAYHNVEDGDLKCLICNVKYETKEEVLFHLKSHSGSRLFKTQSDKKFKCEFCGRLFLTRKDVTRHLVVHTGERDFLCQFCPQRFGRKDHLVRHIKKSHGNEDLVRNEDVKTPAKEETRSPDEANASFDPSTPTTALKRLEISTQTNQTASSAEENKTHILITLQGKALHTRKKHNLHKKPFHKNELLVPKKKQVPLPKPKNPTTQILLKNIPNILIIPNNSIILLRNQASTKKNPDPSHSPSPSPSSIPSQPEPNDTLLSHSLSLPPLPVNTTTTTTTTTTATAAAAATATATATVPSNPPSQPLNPTDFINFNYDSSIFPSPSPSEFLNEFPEADTFCNFHPDLPPFGPHFDEPDFEIPTQSDLLSRNDMGLFPDAPRQSTATSTKSDREKPTADNLDKELFDDGNEALMLNESILNEFKDDPAAILPNDNDVGILSNILNQSNDNCGFELLRHLLTTENPVLSPLPGFSQIFHNSNANSN